MEKLPKFYIEPEQDTRSMEEKLDDFGEASLAVGSAIFLIFLIILLFTKVFL